MDILEFFIAIPGVLLLWLVHIFNLLPWWAWLATMATIVLGGWAWTARASRNEQRFNDDHR